MGTSWGRAAVSVRAEDCERQVISIVREYGRQYLNVLEDAVNPV